MVDSFLDECHFRECYSWVMHQRSLSGVAFFWTHDLHERISTSTRVPFAPTRGARGSVQPVFVCYVVHDLTCIAKRISRLKQQQWTRHYLRLRTVPVFDHRDYNEIGTHLVCGSLDGIFQNPYTCQYSEALSQVSF